MSSKEILIEKVSVNNHHGLFTLVRRLYSPHILSDGLQWRWPSISGHVVATLKVEDGEETPAKALPETLGLSDVLYIDDMDDALNMLAVAYEKDGQPRKPLEPTLKETVHRFLALMGRQGHFSVPDDY